MPHVVDTVALIRLWMNAPNLGAQAARVLDDPSAELLVPAITLAEAKHVIVSRRLPLDVDAILRTVADDPRCIVVPLDLDVVRSIPPAGQLEMHDGIIYATAALAALRLGVPIARVPILTCDQSLIDYGAPTVW